MKKFWGYIKALFRTKSEQIKDPEVEIEQAVHEAKRRDQDLRNQAAKVLAHRTQLESKIDRAADDAGEARELAKQALVKAQEASDAGDAAGTDKWNRAAQGLAMKMQAAENNLSSLKSQFESAQKQADDAKKAVQQNAMRLQELAAKRMELVGSLQQAKMQETVNEAIQAISSTSDLDRVSLDSVEDKIERRKAVAMANAELHEATPDGAEMELKEAVSLAQADAKLAELKSELGM
ncbi:MAG: PspA/IM30 family protein [Acidimicrobiia bacterium]